VQHGFAPRRERKAQHRGVAGRDPARRDRLRERCSLDHVPALRCARLGRADRGRVRQPLLHRPRTDSVHSSASDVVFSQRAALRHRAAWIVNTPHGSSQAVRNFREVRADCPHPK